MTVVPFMTRCITQSYRICYRKQDKQNDSLRYSISSNVQVPADLDQSPTYRVKFECQGGLQYSQTETLNLNPNTSVVLVQTDKAIYKPGQLGESDKVK